MSKKIIVSFTFLVITLFGLSGCDPIPTCAPGSLLAPDLVSPDWREVVDGSSAQLEWSYPDTCEPDQFEIILSQERDYSVIEHTQLVSGSATTWTPPALDIAEEYFWRVRAKVGSTYGDYSHELRSFFTLPYCLAGDLVSPSLTSPDFGGIFDRGYDSLEWSWPLTTCIPESYRVEVSMGSPSFADTTYNGATGDPGTRWGFGSIPPAATQFWWRISAFSDGTWGPPSMAKMFWTDPICTAASLVSPVPVQPLDGDIVTIVNPIFVWTYPDTSCAPEGTHVWVSDTPDMSSIVLEANNPNLASRAFQAGVPFADCGEYYWQISMVSEGVDGPLSPVNSFIIDTAGACECDPTAIPVPDLIWPEPIWTGNYDIVPVNTQLIWDNSGPCIPDGYQVELSASTDASDPALDGVVIGGGNTTYSPPTLLPATQYWWHVYGTFEGALSPTSNYAAFFTEPECGSASELVAPLINSPLDGEVVDNLTPIFVYQQGTPGCIPDHYLINLQTVQDFLGVNLVGEIAFPTTAVGPSTPLADCTWHYLKVAGVQDGTPGPYSDVVSFYTDEQGSCLPPGIPATARQNNFCRVGTFPEHHEAIWTFIAGEHVLVVARNPFTTYLQLMVLDQETKLPFEKVITCWSLLSNFEAGWQPSSSPEGKFSFSDLPVAYPPPTPTPTPPPYCHVNMNEESCENAGGTYVNNNEFSSVPHCECP